MIEGLVEALRGVPPWLATIIVAMLPVGELRAALPLAVFGYQLPLSSAVIFSVIGNLIPVYFLLVFFERVSTWLRARSVTADRFFSWLFKRTRRKLDRQVQRYGYWALTLFVAIPLPVTGAWTGALAAFVFGLPRRQSFFAIAAGVLVAAVIVAVLTMGTEVALRLF